jgi:hypothetical protein
MIDSVGKTNRLKTALVKKRKNVTSLIEWK